MAKKKKSVATAKEQVTVITPEEPKAEVKEEVKVEKQVASEKKSRSQIVKDYRRSKFHK